MDVKPYNPAVRELASRIYVELVLRAAPEAGAKPDPTALARLAFRLADAFQAVEDELNAANLPRNVGFKLENTDIGEWTK